MTSARIPYMRQPCTVVNRLFRNARQLQNFTEFSLKASSKLLNSIKCFFSNVMRSEKLFWFYIWRIYRELKCRKLSNFIEKFTAWGVNSTLNFTRKTDIARIAKQSKTIRFLFLWAAPVRFLLLLRVSGFLKFSKISMSIGDLANIRFL